MYIARQPIFDKSMNVYGYELLYRDSITAEAFNDSSAKIATATVLGGLFELGINDISNNKKSFVNFDHEFLFSDSIELIEPENLIMELLENTDSDDFMDSIKNSLVYMGFKQIERWINILILQDLATNKPIELIRLSLIRSHFGESLSKHSNFKPRTNEVFGMLLFSTLDAILDQPMEKALDGIRLSYIL